MDKVMKNLIVIGHPNKDSFCTSGIAKTIKETLEKSKQEVFVIDLYAENKTQLIGKQATIKYFNLTPDGIPRFPYVINIDRESYE